MTTHTREVKGSIIVHRWDSLSEYVNGPGAKLYHDGYNGGRSWDGGVSGEKAKRLAFEGDPSLVRMATQVCDRVSADHLKGISRPANVPDFMGTRVNVPAYLSNSPRCMVRRKHVERECRHVTIYVNVCCSASVAAEDMLKRGAAVLGLLETLQACQVGVDLYATCDIESSYYHDGPHFQAVKLESRPLDIGAISFVLAHPAFVRHVMYGRGTDDSKNGDYNGTPNRDVKMAEKAYDLQPGDIYIPAVYSRDGANISEQWIDEKLVQILGKSAFEGDDHV